MKFTNRSEKLYMDFCSLKENDLFVQLSDGWVFQKRNTNKTHNAFDFGNDCMVSFSNTIQVKPIQIEEIIFSEVQ